jgi:glycosyltransferase involved in cell wall biosynthesis
VTSTSRFPPELHSNGDGFETLWQLRTSPQAPLATVAVSLFNYEDLIRGCLDSVAAQTVKDLDLVVVDDHSTDGSAEAARSWLQENGGRFSSCLLVRQTPNQGLAAARNRAFELARTESVFVLDADNSLFPRCIEALSTALGNCTASFAYGYLEKFGEVSALLDTKPWDPRALQFGNTIDAMVLHRRSVWRQVGGYSIDMPAMGWEDFDLWFKIAKAQGWGILVPEILGRYRVHHTSMLHTITNPNADRLWSYLRTRHAEFFR